MSNTVRRHSLGAMSLVAVVLCGGCGTSPAGALRLSHSPTATDSPTPSPSDAATPTPSDAATPAPTESATPIATPLAPCADRVFNAMSQDQRIGQVFLLGLANNQLGTAEVNEIQADHVGSVWFTERTYAGAWAIHDVATAVQAQVSGAATANVRFFIAANQEGGLVQALHGSGFLEMPTALAQGGLATSTLQADALTWGQELRAAGVNLNFAPVMDVVPPGFDAQNQPIGALQREYGHDPVTAGSHGSAFLRGMRQAGVAVTLKHFPGLGRVTGNTDYTPATDTITTMNDPYIQSFKQGIYNGADFVMVAIATYTRIDPVAPGGLLTDRGRQHAARHARLPGRDRLRRPGRHGGSRQHPGRRSRPGVPVGRWRRGHLQDRRRDAGHGLGRPVESRRGSNLPRARQ